ncbi:UDP-2,3-diacylglucosamine diphosphatase [Ideonella sp. 4Y11]|uniref:UDP-2,3-diacylglucosamine hydrolase n=1 Tax=Ideonella aquatica TaxID=2824119 RepID=A0A940YM13_9BURK|nr:UDP-2,3-diacylglucosamine diphosphatase [Ideonella aquatica]MBQ0959437.1 UDP-2,3-diacylglucosamine diphosphatase [Ideonella aquatica]
MPEFGLDVLTAPAGARRIEFVSDLHLCAELPRTTEACLSWLAHSQADLLIILGDLFEAWIGDDAADQPSVSQVVSALRDASARRPLAVMRGNRDFLLGEDFFQRSGCTALADPCVLEAFGQRVLLSHGDALCLDDSAYQRFRAEVRQSAWQAAFLARPLAERQAIAGGLRAASQASQAGRAVETYADPDPALASDWLHRAQATTLVHGHTHRPGDEVRAEGWTRRVLSDWDLDHARRAEVLAWTARGWQRHPLPADGQWVG